MKEQEKQADKQHMLFGRTISSCVSCCRKTLRLPAILEKTIRPAVTTYLAAVLIFHLKPPDRLISVFSLVFSSVPLRTCCTWPFSTPSSGPSQLRPITICRLSFVVGQSDLRVCFEVTITRIHHVVAACLHYMLLVLCCSFRRPHEWKTLAQQTLVTMSCLLKSVSNFIFICMPLLFCVCIQFLSLSFNICHQDKKPIMIIQCSVV